MKVELRPLNEIDPYQLAFHANDLKVSKYLSCSFPYPYTIDHALSFINYSLDNHQVGFGIVVDDICIGCIGVTFQRDIHIKNCELGYWIGSKYWNKGIMSYIIPMICQYVFENFHIHKIFAEVIDDNIASRHILEKCGFHQEGQLVQHIYKNHLYYDAILYGMIGGTHGD